jgi:hypothetical protein
MTRDDRGASSFDELAVGLSSGSISRGKALRLMGAALVGGTLGSLGGVAAADEECKSLTKKCRKDEQCCSGNCSKSGTSRFGTCACQENGGSCASNGQCCSGNCGEDHKCAAACGSLGATCTSGGDCCSGNCDSGFCLPPTGLTFLTCVCSDSTSFQRCTSLGCFSDPLFEVCSPLCSSHGGVSSTVCGCDEPPCCSG